MAHPSSSDDSPHQSASDICRGVLRCFEGLHFYGLTEVTLANKRRADVLLIGPKGEIVIVEIKSSVADFKSDAKWHEYAPYCDRFYFAVAEAFPSEIIPAHTGLIVADGFGGDIIRTPEVHPLAPARRKALTLKIARLAAMRLTAEGRS